MIQARYGAVQLYYAFGDKLVAIEVVRQVAQRPVMVAGSWNVSGAATPAQVNGMARLLVYKGQISNEHDSNWSPVPLQSWDAIDGNVTVFVDAFVPYGQTVTLDLRDLPAEVAEVTPGQGLGAMLLQPIASDNILIANGHGVLTFIGESVVTAGEGSKYIAR